MPPVPDPGANPAASDPIGRLADFPREIGPFRILRQIGVGGMGIVFLAEQERPKRTVARKTVHGSDLSHHTRHRFELETDDLAAVGGDTVRSYDVARGR